MNNNLKFLREKFEYTQSQVASLLKMKHQNYSRWETNTIIIPLNHLNALANIYDTNMDYLIGLTNENQKNTKIKNIDYKFVGKKLTEIRIDNNLSMRQLAKILNTTHSTISYYESGKTLILTSFAIELAKKFNISLDWLIGRSENKYIK